MALVHAAASSIPSIEMLITPLRSLRMPPIAPSVIGTLRLTVSCSMPTKLNESPAAAHDRKLMKNAAVASASTTLESFPKPRNSCATATATSTMPRAQPKPCAGSANRAVSLILNPASPERLVNTTKQIVARTRYATPTLRARLRCSADTTMPGADAVLIRPTP